MSVPLDVSLASAEQELPAVEGYASRHALKIDWSPDQLRLVVDGLAAAKTPVRLVGDLAGYRGVPPAWTIVSLPDGKPVNPEPGDVPGGVQTIFHSSGVICVPFNRLAYKEHQGPHEDWKGPANWLSIRGQVTALYLADMVAVISFHLRYSRGLRA